MHKRIIISFKNIFPLITFLACFTSLKLNQITCSKYTFLIACSNALIHSVYELTKCMKVYIVYLHINFIFIEHTLIYIPHSKFTDTILFSINTKQKYKNKYFIFKYFIYMQSTKSTK